MPVDVLSCLLCVLACLLANSGNILVYNARLATEIVAEGRFNAALLWLDFQGALNRKSAPAPSRCACGTGYYCFTEEPAVVTDYRKLFDLTGKTAVVLGRGLGHREILRRGAGIAWR